MWFTAPDGFFSSKSKACRKCPNRHSFQSVPCVQFTSTGWCPYGNCCQYIHDPRLISPSVTVQCMTPLTKKHRKRWGKVIKSETYKKTVGAYSNSFNCITYTQYFPIAPVLVDLKENKILWHTWSPGTGIRATDRFVEALVWNTFVLDQEERMVQEYLDAEEQRQDFPVELLIFFNRQDDCILEETKAMLSISSMSAVRPKASRLGKYLGWL